VILQHVIVIVVVALSTMSSCTLLLLLLLYTFTHHCEHCSSAVKNVTLTPTTAIYIHTTGDINLVNGKPWPKLAVEPRTYRMHWLDSSISRDWSVKFIAEMA
jgi:hypothetical protein